MIWKQLRIPILILTAINLVLIFGRSIIDPNIGERKVTPFEFPATVPLPQWQLVGSQPLRSEIANRPPVGKVVLPSRRYYYQRDRLPLNIRMRYEIETEGEVKQYIAEQAGIRFAFDRPALLIRQHAQLGSYGLFVHQQHAYLSACINSRGGSTFTKAEFESNRLLYDVQLNRIIPWLLAQQPLTDKRCLWTHLSVPLNQSSLELAYAILETAWFDWFEWWQPRFPKP